MNVDAVLVGSVASVVIAVIILVFLIFKVRQLMGRDAEQHKREQK